MVSYFSDDKITFREAAELLNVSTRTIRKWRWEGLNAVKIGGKWMTTRDALEKYLDSRRDDQ